MWVPRSSRPITGAARRPAAFFVISSIVQVVGRELTLMLCEECDAGTLPSVDVCGVSFDDRGVLIREPVEERSTNGGAERRGGEQSNRPVDGGSR